MGDDFPALIAPDQCMDHCIKMKGIYAVCSVHPTVLSAAMHTTVICGGYLLVEATPNQVNQFGGYSGLTPAAFRKMVEDLARNCGFAPERLIFGADHLGPYLWRNENAASAMQKALDLTRAFVAAGFRKLHLDAGMALSGDPAARLSHATVAMRTLQMMAVAEETQINVLPQKTPLAYVIGAEAPTPGGGVEEAGVTVITPPEEIADFLERCQRGLAIMKRVDLWRRIAAVVVQPGVDFGDRQVICYDPDRAALLAVFAKSLPAHMTCEVHATDYQSPAALAALVDDGFQILKVGPCLTFAYRHAIFCLAEIEDRLSAHKKSANRSNIRDIIEAVMLARPQHWQSHYHGTPAQIAWLRRYSLRDRIRYYWSHPDVANALSQMLHNLSLEIPNELLLQYWPDAPILIPDSRPQTLIIHYIGKQLNHYAQACCAA